MSYEGGAPPELTMAPPGGRVEGGSAGFRYRYTRSGARHKTSGKYRCAMPEPAARLKRPPKSTAVEMRVMLAVHFGGRMPIAMRGRSAERCHSWFNPGGL